MILRIAVALSLAGCGGGAHRNNQLLGEPVSLADVAAPHEAIVRRAGDDLVRVYLDTGARELVGVAPGAFACGASVVRIEGGRFAITRSDANIIVDSVEATPEAKCAPDGTRIAIVKAADGDRSAYEVIVIELGTGHVRRLPIPAGPVNQLTWAGASDALFVGRDGPPHRVDLATGAVSEVDRTTWDAILLRAPDRETVADCPAAGLRVERRFSDSRHEFVLVYTARQADPERLAGVGTRVLVAATNHADPPSGHGLTKEKLYGKTPQHLGGFEFTASCSHYVFELEGTWYVGSVATGRFARLIRTGNSPN